MRAKSPASEGSPRSWSPLLAAPALYLAATTLYAQPAALEFSFSNPGARSLGLGGAFVALADDATAAYVNPAGLVQLTRMEVSAELRRWDYSTPFVVGGRLSGDPTGIGVDTTAGLQTEVSSDTLSGLSFLSFVYPKTRWSVAFYRHQLADFVASTETRGSFRDESGVTIRSEDVRRSIDLEILNYGISASFRVVDRFSLGVGLSHYQGDFTGVTGIYLATGPFDPITYTPERRFATQVVLVDDTDVAFNVGLLWSITDQWSLGGFFREGPTFGLRLEGRTGLLFQPPMPEGTLFELEDATVGFPNVYGLGIAFRSRNGAWTTSFEWDHVGYSHIFDSIDFEDLESDTTRIDDADELRVGLEYVFLKTTPVVAARAGVWRDPDHRPRTIEDDLLVRALFPEGSDEIHLAVGVGLAFKKFQLDLAGDFSEFVDTVGLSAIYKF